MEKADLKEYARNMCKDMSTESLEGVVKGMYSSYKLTEMIRDPDAVLYVLSHVMFNIQDIVEERKPNGTPNVISNTPG